MDNRYLRDKARRRRDMARRGRRSDRAYDSTDYGYPSTGYMPGYNDHHSYHQSQHPMQMYPSAYNVGHYIYGPDGSDYDDTKGYHRELEEWIHKLKEHDRFKLPKEEVINKARTMGARFHDYDEMEFYATYLMLISDFKQIANDPHQYIVLAKEWLEDHDVIRHGSEKLCAYLYSIVLGEDDD